MDMEYLVEVEESRPATEQYPSAGPVYRCVFAKQGLLQLPPGLQSPWQFLRDSAASSPSDPALGRRPVTDSQAGSYEWLTFQEVYDSALRVGSAMRRIGVGQDCRCGIYSVNCPEWIIVMEACMSQSIIYAPLYDTLGSNAVEFIINHAEISIVFVQENKLSAILALFCKCSSHLKTIVSMGNISDSQKQEAEQLGVACFSWKQFSQLGSLDCDLPPKQKSDTCVIMYSSGTTGEPKGVVLNNEAIMAQVLSMDQLLRLTDKVVTKEDAYFSFLPLAHIYDQIIEKYCIYKGASIGFWQGDVKLLMDDIQELKPTLFCGVPRIYDRIYTCISKKVSSGGSLKKKLFDLAYKYKLQNLKRGYSQDRAAPFADKLVFDKIRQVLGGRVRIMLSGAAPLPSHVEEFLRVTSCSSLSQGYGLTESCGGCFTSIANVYSMMGTVGVPMMTIEARLQSIPEMGYDVLSKPSQGEICIRGNTMFTCYYKLEDLTKEVLVDGWFHTGDIGELQSNGTMKIIDRKKNIFKLSQGEYVAVEKLENTYLRCPLISSIWVYGNSFESFLVAVVLPEKQLLEDWATKNHESSHDFDALCKNHKARKYVQDELNSTGLKHQLRGFEMLKAIHLESTPFDIDRDLITPTFKLKRPQLLQYYKECIDQMYKEAKSLKA